MIFENLDCHILLLLKYQTACALTLLYSIQILTLFTWGHIWPLDIVIACVCLSQYLSINPEFGPTLTHYPFKLGSPNLNQRYKTPWLRSLLFWGQLTLTSKVRFNWKSKFTYFELVHAITHHLVKLGFANFDQKMHFSTVKISFNFLLDWHWHSILV